MINFAELKNKSENLYPVVLLEKILNYRARFWLARILFSILIFLFALILLSLNDDLSARINFHFVTDYKFIIRAVFFLSASFWLIIKMLDAFFYNLYFSEDSETTFELARVLTESDLNDLVKSFFESHYGKIILIRLGVDRQNFFQFLDQKSHKITDVDFEMFDEDGFITMADYGLALYKQDAEWQNYFEGLGISEEDLSSTIWWVKKIETSKVQRGIWWTRDKLVQIPSLGRNWSFGQIYLLEKYGHSILADKNYLNLGNKHKLYQKYVNELQNVLLKSNGANAVIVAPTHNIAMNIVSTLAKLLIQGRINTTLENRRLFVVDGQQFITETKEKIVFEEKFIKMLIQSNNAGNVVLVFPYFNNFINSAAEIGVDLSDLLTRALSASNVQIIALVDNKGYHQEIETNKNLIEHFEKISVKEMDKNESLEVLQNEAIEIEENYNVIFTYKAIDKIAESAGRYFSENQYEDKIIDLLEEVVIKALRDNQKIITEEKVSEIVSLKTGIPQVGVKSEEKDRLVHLAEILHRRVIGQNLAIESISAAIKRARSGIQNPNRPLGSFLFLGPTGVGKTETTKALAESFFGDEKNIIRFDMSEYSDNEALNKLIGGPHTKAAGNLAAAIRENQYGILLLDEFEKAHQTAHDLFLQIIDEGQFTDARGEKINARNLIIIATSNAGSDLIYQATLEKQDLQNGKEKIINEIIERKIFKPELINRFDGVILFHPLAKEHISEIAKLMLRKLDNRLMKKGIRLDISGEMIDYLVVAGYSPQFGARAMNRIIQDEIENQIADAMIEEKIKGGNLVRFAFNSQEEKLKIVV